jgi:uncharacterized membrane protein YcaP (DUF421 family)
MLLRIDWTKLLLGEEDWPFLLEIAIRTFAMYIIILIGLRLLGKRGVGQLSVFELVVIISLGSAAGDPMFYKEVGMLIPVVIFTIIVSSYRLTTYLTAKSSDFDTLVEGKATYLIRDGEFSIGNFSKEGLAYDEFFSELRQYSISHLGQVETAIIETSGNISVYFYPDEKVRYGLPILPELFANSFVKITKTGIYACSFCGNVENLEPADVCRCRRCNREGWVTAIDSIRVK